MKKILDLISDEMMQAFEQAGYDRALGRVTLSRRPGWRKTVQKGADYDSK